ncbi:hypothetical protein [Streptomyces sp. SID3343]|uniref:hypothetical protein n=1 Tax=Streptomyces sp. SID3343 TaxID=2690260 RepID=UPI001369925E|nr:hypothetical protein [Streptomyces sp. SID3343]MYW04138.1 hypothetical protein [Streptomyces sp. SID3343]
MEGVRVVVFVLLGGVAFVVWRRSRYPGGWAFAFGARYVGDRKDLARARRELRGLEKKSGRLEAAARERVGWESTEYGRRVDALKRAVKDLRDPGLGVRLTGRAGELVLYEHAVVSSGAGTIPLAGLRARFESGRQAHSIYLTQPDGRVYRAKYPHRPVPTADEAESVQFFEEDRVRDFAVEIKNAVADENDFRSHLPAWLEQRQEEPAEARQDTASLDAARRHLSQVLARQSSDPRRKAALVELSGARPLADVATSAAGQGGHRRPGRSTQPRHPGIAGTPHVPTAPLPARKGPHPTTGASSQGVLRVRGARHGRPLRPGHRPLGPAPPRPHVRHPTPAAARRVDRAHQRRRRSRRACVGVR